MKSEIRQFDVIKAMRFPLIVLVVISHSLGFERIGIIPSLDGWNVYHFFSEMISHNFAKIAVCWFFVFSGYLFFRNLEGAFSWNRCFDKWKKRCRSLLVPYVAWNLILILAIVLKNVLFSAVGLGTDDQMETVKQFRVIDWLWTGPANFPLWYMRDLIVLSLLAPAWYCFFKYGKKLSLAVLIILYASGWNPAIPGMRGIFFFGIGAYMGINKVDILQVCNRIRKPSFYIATVTLVAASYFNSASFHEYLLRLFYPFGMAAFMNICADLTKNDRVRSRLFDLSGTVFFIYATHEIYILGWTKGLFLRLFGNGLLGTVISYLGVPIVVLAVCFGLFSFFKKFTPRTLSILSGERN